MDYQIVCPLPELADALQPYIHSREEVAHIRHAIDRAILNDPHEERVRPISRLRLSDSDVVRGNIGSTALGGVRSAYGNAVVAHQNAQARLRALRAELAASQTSSTEIGSQEHAACLTGTLEAISHIRREQRRRKLDVVDQSIDELERHRQQSRYADVIETVDIDKQLPLPPPVAAAPQRDTRGQVASDILRLKKAVLAAQNLVDNGMPDDAASDHSGDAAASRHTLALTRARDNMITWLETELAKIPESNESHSSHELETAGDAADTQQVTEQHVQDLYLQYIAARRTLVGLMSANKDEGTASDAKSPRTESSAAPPRLKPAHEPTVTLAADILPFCEELSNITEAEAGLMQESVFVRRQLAWSSEKTRQLVHRLADESHLVAPGVTEVKDWVRAGREVRKADAEMVQARLLTGEDSLRRAREAT